MANLAHVHATAFSAIVGAPLAGTTNFFRATFPIPSRAFIVALRVWCQIREVLAFRANICGVTFATSVEAARARVSGFIVSLLVEAIWTICPASAVWIQIAKRVALKAYFWPCANTAICGATQAASPTILAALRIVAARASINTIEHLVQVQGIVTLKASCSC